MLLISLSLSLSLSLSISLSLSLSVSLSLSLFHSIVETFNTARMFLSHLGMLGIESIKVSGPPPPQMLLHLYIILCLHYTPFKFITPCTQYYYYIILLYRHYHTIQLLLHVLTRVQAGTQTLTEFLPITVSVDMLEHVVVAGVIL